MVSVYYVIIGDEEMEISDRQAGVLRKNGYSEEAINKLTKSQASTIIDGIFNGPKPANQYPKQSTYTGGVSSVSSPRVVDKDRLIVRQSCLKVATDLVISKIFPEADVKVLAEEFEKWVFRE